MLESIRIKNFRCFEDFNADGFERINLIGGLNNSGKSCLLEGILACFMQNHLYNMSDALRQQTDAESIYNTRNTNDKIEFIVNIEKHELKKTFTLMQKNERFENSSFELNINYVSPFASVPFQNTLYSLDNIQINKLDLALVEILKVIDSRISNLRSYRSKGDVLYVQTEDNIDLPLNVFGDATKNLIKYFAPIFEKKANKNNKLSILLIDEIDTGLHYSSHKQIWEKIFEMCISENVQLFTTTHSREMIETFAEVASKKGNAAYFEMAREFETDKVFITKHDIELLEYELERPNSTFRGE